VECRRCRTHPRSLFLGRCSRRAPLRGEPPCRVLRPELRPGGRDPAEAPHLRRPARGRGAAGPNPGEQPVRRDGGGGVPGAPLRAVRNAKLRATVAGTIVKYPMTEVRGLSFQVSPLRGAGLAAGTDDTSPLDGGPAGGPPDSPEGSPDGPIVFESDPLVDGG